MTWKAFPSLFLAGAAVVALVSSSPVRADYSSTVLSDAPAGYWRLADLPVTLGDIQVTNIGSLGEAANGVYGGYVGRQEEGALSGSDNKANRFWGNIAELSRVTMGSAASFNFTGNGDAQPFTLEVWAKPMMTPTGSQRMIANGSSGQGYGFSLQGNNTLRLTAFGVADVTSDVYAPTFVSNQWYHLVMVRSNASVYFYVNGAQLGAGKTLNNIKTTANPLTLGRTAAGAEPFTGVLDEPAVYNKVLTPAQIAAHYDAGLNNGAGYESVILADAPIGYWRLNEPRKVESTSVIANSGSLGTVGDGAVFGSLNSVTGGVTSPLVGDANPAMGFPGPDGRIDVPFNAALNPSSFTVECWARMDAWANAHLSPVTSRQSAADGTRGFMIYAAPHTLTGTYTNRPRWEFWTGTGSAFNTVNAGLADVQTNKWTHLVGTYDAETRVMALYVDGTLARGLINVTYAPCVKNPLRIGAGSSELNYGQYHWRGAVDEVAVYPTALSPQRVQAHYEAALGVSPPVTAAPGVQVQPQGQTNWAPYPIIVSCVVTGSLPMQFQWYQVLPDYSATIPVPEGTNMVLKLDPTSDSQSGHYYLAATNALGGTESSWAYVEIHPLTAPMFTLNAPATVPVYGNGTAGIPVVVSGTPPITYQWESNSVPVPGGTNAVLAVPGVQPSYASASFRVKATNPISTSTSDPAQLSVLTAPVSTYAAVATSLNPLGYWRLGEDSGTVAFDYWGGHPGVYVNSYANSSPGALTDDDDGCVQLYGAGSYVRMLETNAFGFTGTTSQFTLAAWIKADSWPSTGARIFSTRWLVGNTGGFGFGIWNGNSYRFTAFGVTDIAQGLPTLSLGQWYHIAAVCSNNTVYFYLNGTYQGAGNTVLGAAGIKPTPYPLQLGGNPNFSAAADEEPFSGQIDEAAVFGRVLTAAEIKALYDARYGSLLPPSIVRNPAAVQLYAGGTARFSVEAIGSAPLSYQWKTNGIAITGATNDTLVLAGVTTALNGVNITVTVANQADSVTTANAPITVLAAPSTGYTAAVLQDNPAALWRLGDPAFSAVAYDSWGSHNGAVNGNVAFGTAGALYNDSNTAATLDGVSPTRVEAPYAPELNTTNFTVECWARVTGGAGTYRAAVSSRNQVQGSAMGGYVIYATSGNVWSFWTGNGTTWVTLNGPPVVENQWTHLVATFDGTDKRFYVNGVLVATGAATLVPNPVRPFRIGGGMNEADPGDYFFVGDIDEVAVYNTVLPAERIEYHYALGKYSVNTAPFFTRLPQAQSVMVGTPVTLAAEAGGSPFLGYQWIKDGLPVPGATQASLSFASAGYGDNGMYSLTITNALGMTNSPAVKLAVLPPPTFALVTNDLVLHLKFENDYNDASGRANHGFAVGMPGFVPGKIGSSALHYNTDTNLGVYNYVTLGVPSDLQFSSNVSFSVSYWTKFTGTPPDLPFFCNAVNSYGNWGFTFAPSWQTGGWSWSLGSSAGYVGVYGAANSINDGNWHHLTHTFDRSGEVSTAITYLDGVQVDARSAAVVADIDSGATVNIGQDPTGVYPITAAADLDDLAVWRRVLTTYEAQSIYLVGQQYGSSFDTVQPIQLIAQRAGDDLELIWQAGTLLEADNVTGPYSPVAGAAAPYHKVAPGAAKKFYKVGIRP